MKFPCELQTFATVKKGSRITLALDDDATEIVLKGIQNYNKLPLTCELSVDIDQRKKQLATISPEQRAKIYALFKDIAAWSGDSADSIKAEMKKQYCAATGQEEFSLSNCAKELSGDFIEWLIQFAFENGIELKEHPREAFDNIDDYLRMCIKNRICAICGKPADIHHADAIGMGGTSKPELDSLKRKIALCRVHHTEAHQIGKETFEKKYHVWGVLM